MKLLELKNKFKNVLWSIRRKRWARRVFFFVLDVFALTFAILAAFYLRFDGSPSEMQDYIEASGIILSFVLATKIPIFCVFRLYDISWSFASVRDAIYIAFANFVASMTFYSGYEFVTRGSILPAIPRSVAIIDMLLSFLFISVIRFSKRAVSYALRSFQNGNGNSSKKKNLLIIGAGNAGEQLIRSLLKNGSRFRIVGIIDDNPSKWGTYLHGIKVYGGRDKIPQILSDFDVDSVIIAIPSASGTDVKEFVKMSRNAGIKDIRILPAIAELVDGTVSIKDVRSVSLDDLLGRAQVQIELDEVASFLKGKTVMVTGSSGSIGEELCRQIAKFDPRQIILFEIDETRLFDTQRKLQYVFPDVDFVPVLGDVRDKNKVFCSVRTYSPQIIFHAAAYKHVPMMEAFPEEAVKTNIIGTYNVGRAAVKYGVEKFVFISTDKAVNPTSVMGATKRVGEMIILALNQLNVTKFVAVRFGNVLGSRGSVIPIFKEQIERGGPVTVTHPEMRRYFMTIPEAVLLVIQAGAMGEGGEVFVLDMGEPIRIVDIAKELITLMGYEADKDIPIVFTGIRPGEKLFEELLTAEEGTEATRHEKVFKARLTERLQPTQLFRYVDALSGLAYTVKRREIVKFLKAIVPSYRPYGSRRTKPVVEIGKKAENNKFHATNLMAES